MRTIRRIRSTVLTLGAVLGVICVILVGVGVVFGMKPTIVISGSMEPELPVGSMVLSKKVPVSEIGPGDIVTVPRTDGEGLITHRVVEVEPVDHDGALLTLKGDANDSPDSAPYPVREVGRHILTIPYLGDLALFVRTPIGLITTLGVLLAAFLLLSPTAGSRPPGNRRERGGRHSAKTGPAASPAAPAHARVEG